MLDVGCRMLDVGCRMLDVGCWMSDVGCWMLDVDWANGPWFAQPRQKAWEMMFITPSLGPTARPFVASMDTSRDGRGHHGTGQRFLTNRNYHRRGQQNAPREPNESPRTCRLILVLRTLLRYLNDCHIASSVHFQSDANTTKKSVAAASHSWHYCWLERQMNSSKEKCVLDQSRRLGTASAGAAAAPVTVDLAAEGLQGRHKLFQHLSKPRSPVADGPGRHHARADLNSRRY
jgi:hypothetical protein